MPNSNTSAQDWLTGFARQLHRHAPDSNTIQNLLKRAGGAAHDSERIAAPIACWMIGVAGMDPHTALALAEKYVTERVS